MKRSGGTGVVFNCRPRGYPAPRLRLQFDATDYYADVWLNGRRIGRHEGYIDPYEYDVTGKLKEQNEIRVRVWTPVNYYWRHRPYTVKGSYGDVDQKPDDITPLGITRSVRVVASDQAIIRDLAVSTRLADDQGTEADVEVELATDGPAEERLGGYSPPENLFIRHRLSDDGAGLAVRPHENKPPCQPSPPLVDVGPRQT